MNKALELSIKYNTLLNKNGINSKLRTVHFFAQIAHESGGFKYLKELGNKSYFDKYEGRKDLGNTQSGDGFKFKGRGYIQITGRANYTELSKDLDIDFVNNPELLEQEVNAMVSALWFWNKRNLNKYADLDDVKTITKKINGGLNGLDDRIKYLNQYKQIFK